MRTAAMIVATLALASGQALAADRTVVVELFTSQGCSSCPPADAILQDVAKQPGVLALSRPITYWDDLGWKDTLARPENTEKQKAYSRAMGKGGRIYTPQVVVDGQAEGIGSEAGTVEALMMEAAARPEGATIAASPLENAMWRIAVSNGGGGAEIHLVSYRPEARVQIDAGENEGEEIAYSNVVVSDTILGTASDGASFDTGSLSPEGDLHWAVVVQDGDAGPIRAAAKLQTGATN